MMCACIFLYLTVFSTSRYSKLGTVTFYSIYLIEYVLYSLPLLPFFRLGVLRSATAPAPLYYGGHAHLFIVVGGYYLDYPLDLF